MQFNLKFSLKVVIITLIKLYSFSCTVLSSLIEHFYNIFYLTQKITKSRKILKRKETLTLRI